MVMFKAGDRVLVRQVGVGTVVAISRNDAFGAERDFYEIRPDKQSSTIYIPTDLDPAERGLRRVMTARKARQVLDVLATQSTLVNDQEWRRGLKERQKAADAEDQATLVRDMLLRLAHRRLSSQEKAYLEKATEVLIDEMVEAMGQSTEEVRQAVERAIQQATEAEKIPSAK